MHYEADIPFWFCSGNGCIDLSYGSRVPGAAKSHLGSGEGQVRSGNPALKADADTVDEMKAAEITAYLRPNPQLTSSADGTQIVPHDGIWTPFKGTFEQPTSAICTNATTSANSGWRVRRKARASLSLSMKT